MDAATIAIVVSILAAPLAAFVTWFFNRKKYVADIYTSISESSQNAVETMQAAMNTLHTELNGAQQKIAELSEQIITLQQQLLDFKTQWASIEADNIRLKIQVYELMASLQSYAIDDRDATIKVEA